ncbi:nose resistant to fluoxetine protein 6-like isoform X1 [Dreissena polymorpha]|uniref:nose resistant to fluoxetine protein 6-like isoform X1 n=1 Tax=Dreissena polymorpha TaxID=45954 RepID=UPI0022646F3E|nr:nose resistant to fluoxetine protein 6-like isoform X1 [Dreissena polymorpha]
MKLVSVVILLWLQLSCTFSQDDPSGNFVNEVQRALKRQTHIQDVANGIQTRNALGNVFSRFVDSPKASVIKSVLDSLLAEVGAAGISEACMNSTNLMLAAAINKDQWALRMIDAIGKPPSGILDFNLKWLGNYDECLETEVSVLDNSTGLVSEPFEPQYCQASFYLGQNPAAVMTGGYIIVNIGMCLPDKCDNNSASLVAQRLIQLIPLNFTKSIPPPGMVCQNNHLPWSSSAVAAIVLCCVFIALMVTATVYDALCQYVWIPTNKLSDEKYADYGTKEADSIIGNGHVSNGHVSNGHVSNGHVSNGHVSYGAVSNGPYRYFGDGHANDSFIADAQDLSAKHVSHHKADLKEIKYDIPANSKKYTPGVLGKLLLSFSVLTNARKILNTDQPSQTLTSVNGIRFISMTWVVLGHTYVFGLGVVGNTATILPKFFKRFSFQCISNAFFAVDTFFVLSGLLVAYLTLREMDKRGGAKKFSWGMYYFHRIWRLTPPYMLVMFVYTTLINHWGNGPMWPQQGFDPNNCNTWWMNLLYINNFQDSKTMCMGWSWYLANDMQFYIISPLILVLLFYSRIGGVILSVAFVIGNFISAGVVTNAHNFSANMLVRNRDEEGDPFALLYIKPWTRIGPYIVGLLTGYVLYKTKCKVTMSKIVNIIGWILAAGLAIAILYGLYSDDGTIKFNKATTAFYNATSRTVWGACVAWVVFACATGYGGPVNALLSWKGIVPLSRLTYCCYLVHPIVMYTYYYTQRQQMYWFDLEVSYTFLGHLCMTYGVAFIVSLAFESPMMGLENVILGRAKKH